MLEKNFKRELEDHKRFIREKLKIFRKDIQFALGREKNLGSIAPKFSSIRSCVYSFHFLPSKCQKNVKQTTRNPVLHAWHVRPIFLFPFSWKQRDLARRCETRFVRLHFVKSTKLPYGIAELTYTLRVFYQTTISRGAEQADISYRAITWTRVMYNRRKYFLR